MLRIDELSSDRYGELAALIGATSASWQPTVDEIAQMWSSEPKHVQGLHMLAYEGDAVVGYGGAANLRYEFESGRFNFQVRVLPTHRHRGIGQALAARLDTWLHERAPEELVAQTDGREDGERFALARGFVVIERRYEQRVSPSTFDASPGAIACRDAARSCAKQNVRLVTLETLRAEGFADLERKLYELHNVVMDDEPTNLVGEPMRFEDWCEQFLAPHDPAGAIIAMYTDQLVGLTIHWPESNVILIAATGTLAAWRGRGVAKALKLASVDYARSIGLPLRTMNNAANEPILRLNQLCGFERVATFSRWQRRPAF